MKKIFSILLAVLLMLNTFGFDVYFGFVIQKCKYEAERTGSDEGLTEMVLTPAEESLLNYTGRNEFKMNGRHYDIVKKEYSGGKVRIMCYDDENEDKALEEYHSLNKEENNPASSQNAGYVLNNLIKNYIAPAGLVEPVPAAEAGSVEFTESIYITAPPQINPPPPKPLI